jgi:hypothetical protein
MRLDSSALADGYVETAHNTRYSLVLRNHMNARCDTEVTIDGTSVGTWRIAPMDEIQIERPAYDSGRFTFFVVGSPEAALAGINPRPKNGLVSATFAPRSTVIPPPVARSWLDTPTPRG